MNDAISSPFRVLVVEDEECLRELIAEMLRQCCGCQTDLARDGREAMQHVRNRSYDLILTDFRLPGFDGPTFYHALCSHAPAQADRVAFMTGLDPHASPLREFLERSHCPTLRKPFGMKELGAFVRELLPVGA